MQAAADMGSGHTTRNQAPGPRCPNGWPFSATMSPALHDSRTFLPKSRTAGWPPSTKSSPPASVPTSDARRRSGGCNTALLIQELRRLGNTSLTQWAVRAEERVNRKPPAGSQPGPTNWCPKRKSPERNSHVDWWKRYPKPWPLCYYTGEVKACRRANGCGPGD